MPGRRDRSDARYDFFQALRKAGVDFNDPEIQYSVRVLTGDKVLAYALRNVAHLLSYATNKLAERYEREIRQLKEDASDKGEAAVKYLDQAVRKLRGKILPRQNDDEGQ